MGSKNARNFFRYSFRSYFNNLLYFVFFVWLSQFGNLAYGAADSATLLFLDPYSLQPMSSSEASGYRFAGKIEYGGVTRWLALKSDDYSGSQAYTSQALGGGAYIDHQALSLAPEVYQFFRDKNIPGSTSSEKFGDDGNGNLVIYYNESPSLPPYDCDAGNTHLGPNDSGQDAGKFSDSISAHDAAHAFIDTCPPINSEGQCTHQYSGSCGNGWNAIYVTQSYYIDPHKVFHYFRYYPNEPPAVLGFRSPTIDDFRSVLESELGSAYTIDTEIAINKLLEKIKNTLSASQSDNSKGYMDASFGPNVKDSIEGAINDPAVNPEVEQFIVEVDSMTPTEKAAASQPQFISIDPESIGSISAALVDAVGSINIEGGATASEIETAMVAAEAANNPVLADLIKQALIDTQQPVLNQSDIELGFTNALNSHGSGSFLNAPGQPLYDSTLDTPIETDLVPILDDGINSVLNTEIVGLVQNIDSLVLTNPNPIISCTVLNKTYELDFSKYESYIDLFGNFLYSIVVVIWTISLFL